MRGGSGRGPQEKWRELMSGDEAIQRLVNEMSAVQNKLAEQGAEIIRMGDRVSHQREMDDLRLLGLKEAITGLTSAIAEMKKEDKSKANREKAILVGFAVLIGQEIIKAWLSGGIPVG